MIKVYNIHYTLVPKKEKVVMLLQSGPLNKQEYQSISVHDSDSNGRYYHFICFENSVGHRSEFK